MNDIKIWFNIYEYSGKRGSYDFFLGTRISETSNYVASRVILEVANLVMTLIESHFMCDSVDISCFCSDHDDLWNDDLGILDIMNENQDDMSWNHDSFK